MGNANQVGGHPSVRIHEKPIHPKCEISRLFYQDIEMLAVMFRNFTQQPYHYVCTVNVEEEKEDCCRLTSLVLHTKPTEITLDNLFVIKRKHKQNFSEQEIWYTLKYLSGVLGYLEGRGLSYGIINPNNFVLDSGRYLRISVKHLRPQNQHFFDHKLTNYYSPEYIQCLRNDTKSDVESINKFKSEVFSVGLLILEMASVPHPKPKFYSLLTKEMNIGTINRMLELVKMNYSPALCSILNKMLSTDLRNRADWVYVNQWIFRNEDRKFDVAPCIFGLY